MADLDPKEPRQEPGPDREPEPQTQEGQGAPEPQDTQEPQPQKPAYTPASVEKRIAAWMGLGYMLMLLFVLTFSIFTGGKTLPGTFPLLLLPVCAAAAALSIYRQRKGAASLPLTVFAVAVCLFGILLSLALGGPALVAAIQGAYPA